MSLAASPPADSMSNLWMPALCARVLTWVALTLASQHTPDTRTQRVPCCCWRRRRRRPNGCAYEPCKTTTPHTIASVNECEPWTVINFEMENMPHTVGARVMQHVWMFVCLSDVRTLTRYDITTTHVHIPNSGGSKLSKTCNRLGILVVGDFVLPWAWFFVCFAQCALSCVIYSVFAALWQSVHARHAFVSVFVWSVWTLCGVGDLKSHEIIFLKNYLYWNILIFKLFPISSRVISQYMSDHPNE